MSAQREQVLDYSWLHDDTEEDLVGADWHQHAIRALSTSLQALADERRWPWHVGDQLTLIGEKPDGKEWRPAPDVSIQPQLGPEPRQDIDVRVDGPPALVLEVASASTWRYDVSLESTRRGKRQAGKAFGYLVLLRVPEYLVFDPRGEFLTDRVRAWQRVGDVIQPLLPDADGSYHSQSLGITLRPDGILLRVFDPEGNPVPYWFEAARTARAQAQEIAELRAALELLRRPEPRA
jgi:Uma2 family endonuclease